MGRLGRCVTRTMGPVVGAAVALLVVAPSVGRAYGVDPPATPIAGPVETDPAACLVEPRPAAEIVALVGTPAPGAADEAPSPPPPMTPPPGRTADPATAAAVEAVLRELVACLELGEFARAYALTTDAFVRRTVGPLDEEERALLAGVGFPNAGERTPPGLAVAEVRLLADGRAFAQVWVRAPELTEPRARGFLLVRVDGRWLVDAAADIAGVDAPAP